MGFSRSNLRIRRLWVTAVMLAAMAVLPAQASDDGRGEHWYGGIGVGQSINDGRNLDITTAPGLCMTFPCHTDDVGVGSKLFAGYQFNNLFGLEAEYTRLPNTLEVHSVDFTAVPTAILGVSQDSQVLSVRGVLTKSIVAPFSVSAVLGASLWKSDMEAKIIQGGAVAAGASDTEQAHGFSMSFGARINYDLNDNLRLRGAWDRYTNLGEASAATILRPGLPLVADTVHTNTDLFSIELVYRFR